LFGEGKLGQPARLNILRRWQTLPIEVKSLCIVTIALSALILFRTYDFWTTGFLVSDEHEYLFEAITGSIYGNRYFFGTVNILLFRIFRISDIDSFFFLFPVYLAFWDLLTVFVFYKILRLLEVDGRTMAVSLFSSLFMISFVLLSLGFLTETVGLAMAMLGIYFIIAFAKKAKKPSDSVKYPLLAALSLSAAMYTREPYTIFLIGGIFIVAFLALASARAAGAGSRRKAFGVASLAIIAFAIPAAVFLNWPGTLLGEVEPAASGIGQTIVSPVVTNATTSIVTVPGRNVTGTTTTTTVVNSTTRTITITTVSSQTTTEQVQQNVLLNSGLVNTFWIFFGGIFLGWGPILFFVGITGLVLLLLRFKRAREPLTVTIVSLCLLAFGSYLVVSYLFSGDPTYLTFAHYSTIIRFSDTATPAYFLLAPFAFPALVRRPRVLYGFVAVLLVLSVALIPTYQSYAASNLSLQTNPYTLGYRTPGVDLRDYVSSNAKASPFNIMGFPPSTGLPTQEPAFDSLWWTPGGNAVQGVNIYPYLSESTFTQYHWTSFYLYYYGVQDIQSQAAYLYPAVVPSAQQNSTLPFKLLGEQVIFHDSSGGTLIEIQLSWVA